MLTHEQNEQLVTVEGDSAMGKLMREHYWIPACLSTQLEVVAHDNHLRLKLRASFLTSPKGIRKPRILVLGLQQTREERADRCGVHLQRLTERRVLRRKTVWRGREV